MTQEELTVVGDRENALRARVAELEAERDELHARFEIQNRSIQVANRDTVALTFHVAELEAALTEARSWVQDDVDADPRKRGTDVLARIAAALAKDSGE